MDLRTRGTFQNVSLYVQAASDKCLDISLLKTFYEKNNSSNFVS